MNKLRTIIRMTVLLLSAIVASGCTHEKKADSSPEFVLSDTMMAHITIDTVQLAPVHGKLVLTGKIVANQDNTIQVYPLIGGEAEDVSVELGDYVTKGQTLAVIRSSEIADYEQQRTTAQSNLLSAEKNFAVTQDMYKSKLVSEKEYIISSDELEQARGEKKRIDEIFQIYHISDGSEYIVKSPISGFIVEKNITKGTQLRSDHSGNIFTVSPLQEVWVLADVYETDIANVKLGYQASVSTLSYPDKIFKGKIDKIYAMLDPITKVLKVRIRLENKSFLLKPEMFTTVTIDYLEDEKKLSVPSQAVIFDKNKNFVMVYNGASSIQTREVTVYKIVNDIAYVNTGLLAGDTVISRYNLLVYDALND